MQSIYEALSNRIQIYYIAFSYIRLGGLLNIVLQLCKTEV